MIIIGYHPVYAKTYLFKLFEQYYIKTIKLLLIITGRRDNIGDNIETRNMRANKIQINIQILENIIKSSKNGKVS